MGFLELLLVPLLVLIVGLPLALAAIVSARGRRIDDLEQRLRRIEQLVSAIAPVKVEPGGTSTAIEARKPPHRITEADIAVSAEPVVLATEVKPPSRPGISWEALVGGRALGWAAVIVLLFATAFFLRYAFENQWIGPVGRVSLGILGGIALATAGRYYHARGWRVFSQMLTAGGVILLYLSMYGAFGFYHLIAQREAGLVLTLLVAEAALVAMRYEAPSIALMAALGGLLTPLLMQTDRDQYVSLFTYLAVLDGGFLVLLSLRAWPAIGSVALVGTQFLFWNWHAYNYHPEKLRWALGFQVVIYLLFLAHTIVVCAWRPRARIEDLIRMLVNAAFWFAAAYVLLDADYHDWLGSLAVAMAAVYALYARWLLTRQHDNVWPLLVAIGIAAGFIGLAIPLQADAPWVAMGWAAEAGVLWWFRVRVRASPLRAMAFVFAALAIGRIMLVDTPWRVRPLFTPIFNQYAAPALSATACLAASLLASRRWVTRLNRQEQWLAVGAAIGCVLFVWFVISVDVSSYFSALAEARPGVRDWRWLGQTWLSAWWAVYATIVLAAGFMARQAWLRWAGLALYAITIGKVFVVDMSSVEELYRVVAFFVLAVVLGAAAWAYHRFHPERMFDTLS